MALKRKRSSAAISCPTPDACDATTQSSGLLPFFYAQSKPVEPVFYKPAWSWPTYDDQPSSQHLNSRTRKRHRDDRPDEQQVYASTINRLYEAQRQHPNASPILSQSHSQAPAQPPTSHPQRSTLHSFWRIGQPPSTVPMAIDSESHAVTKHPETGCEDCERPLRHDDGMDVDEYMLDEEMSCQSCRRRVCDTCAVLRDARVCLACAIGGR